MSNQERATRMGLAENDPEYILRKLVLQSCPNNHKLKRMTKRSHPLADGGSHMVAPTSQRGWPIGCTQQPTKGGHKATPWSTSRGRTPASLIQCTCLKGDSSCLCFYYPRWFLLFYVGIVKLLTPWTSNQETHDSQPSDHPHYHHSQ